MKITDASLTCLLTECETRVTRARAGFRTLSDYSRVLLVSVCGLLRPMKEPPLQAAQSELPLAMPPSLPRPSALPLPLRSPVLRSRVRRSRALVSLGQARNSLGEELPSNPLDVVRDPIPQRRRARRRRLPRLVPVASVALLYHDDVVLPMGSAMSPVHALAALLQRESRPLEVDQEAEANP